MMCRKEGELYRLNQRDPGRDLPEYLMKILTAPPPTKIIHVTDDLVPGLEGSMTPPS